MLMAGPPIARVTGAITFTPKPVSNNPPDTASTSVSISSRISFMTCLLKRKARTPWEQPVESAGIPDLAVQDLVRLSLVGESDRRATDSAAAEGRVGVAAESLSVRESDVRHVENVEAATANHGLDFRIDKFTNHLNYSKEF